MTKLILLSLLISGMAFSQELPETLFPNQENYDLQTLLKSNAPLNFSDAEITNILTLSNAVEDALRNNLLLAQAKKDMESAQALHTGAIQDFYVPNLSTTIGMNFTDYFGEGNPSSDQGFYMNFNVPSISLSKTVFNGLGTMYSYRVAKENYMNASNLYENKKREIVYETVLRYYDQILKQEEVKITLERLKQLQNQLDQAEINFRNGRVSDLDVALSRSQFYAAQPAYYTAEKNRLYAQEEFYRYIGKTNQSNTFHQLKGELLDVTNVQFTEFDEQESLKFIMTNDSTLSQLRTAYNNSINQKGIQNSVRLPKIDVNFNYTPSYGESIKNFSNAKYQGSYGVGVALRIPILEWIPGTGVASKVKSAQKNIEKAGFALLDAEEQKVTELKKTFLTLRELKQNVEALKIAEEQAQIALRSALSQYRNGRISIIELDKTQVDYIDAKNKLLQSVYQEFQAKLMLQASMSTFPMFMGEISKIISDKNEVQQ